MREIWKFGIVLCLLGAPVIQAEVTQQDLVSQLPNCALTCLTNTFANSQCQPTDKACTCSNEEFQNEVTDCVIKTCTVKESLITKNLTLTYCDAAVRDNSAGHVLITNFIGILACLCILQRLVFKAWWGLDLGPDDWVMLAVGISNAPALVVNQYGLVENGLGRDVWTLPFNEITNFGIYFYAMVVTYFGQVMLLKMALLFFYLRIFPTNNIRRILWGTMIFTGIIGAFFMLLAAFECMPISYFWTRWDGEHHGHCANIDTIAWTNSTISIAIDIWMIIVPMWQLKNLNIPWKKKLAVGIMFTLGTLVTIISIFRLYILMRYGNSDNKTWDYLQIVRWSIIEIAIGQICACMPSIRMALVRLFPSFRDAPPLPIQYPKTLASRLNLAYFGTNTNGIKTNFSQIHSTSTNLQIPKEGPGIVCERSFSITVDMSDEVELVHAKDADMKSNRSEITL